jgi:hypothetical protein
MAGKGSLRADIEDALAELSYATDRAAYLRGLLGPWQHYKHDEYAVEAVEDQAAALAELRKSLMRAYRKVEEARQ